MKIFFKYLLFFVALVAILYGGMQFRNYAQAKYNQNPAAKNVWVAITKDQPVVSVVDLDDETIDDFAEYSIYCNADYKNVTVVVTVYDLFGEPLKTQKFSHVNLKRYNKYYGKFEIPLDFLFDAQEIGVYVESYE